ncbi:hypothetical protein QUF88_21900 [Bacillus sp. DX1.1]|nr:MULTISPECIES: hypothetical protein [unclassified Bacillus (in: firmicutes)]MDM5156368.1 hypothetical protein [Bacillus sp. DX1.1]WJE80640.1 hypothetical protein QRE67_19435 [Bacillus sp. DX3.1]
MRKVLLSLMGIVTVLALTVGVTNSTKSQQPSGIIQGLSVGDGGG